MASIYALTDPRTGEIRYIGKANDPERRLASHMRDSVRRDTPVYRWIRKVGRPGLTVICADCADWRQDERRLIAEARQRGERLLNVADGGDEPFCPPETRAANGRLVAELRASTPSKKRFYELKRSLGEKLKRGHVSDALRVRMRQAAAERPDLFGEWAHA